MKVSMEEIAFLAMTGLNLGILLLVHLQGSIRLDNMLGHQKWENLG